MTLLPGLESVALVVVLLVGLALAGLAAAGTLASFGLWRAARADDAPVGMLISISGVMFSTAVLIIAVVAMLILTVRILG